MIVDRRLWLTADKKKLVEDGHSKAAFLWAIAGSKRDDAEADALGYRPAGARRPRQAPEVVEAPAAEVDPFAVDSFAVDHPEPVDSFAVEPEAVEPVSAAAEPVAG